jgi:hydrogenase expression/formation protein HypC
MCLAVPGRVVSISRTAGLATAVVDVGGVERTLRVDYLPDVRVGDYVVASLGFAVRRLSRSEALATYEALARIHDLSGLDLPTVGDDGT